MQKYDYKADRERLEKMLDERVKATMAPFTPLPNPHMSGFNAGRAAREIGLPDICNID